MQFRLEVLICVAAVCLDLLTINQKLMYSQFDFSPSLLQSKHMTSCYWGSSSSAADSHDPSLPYLEQYRIDPVQFTQLFTVLAPWVCGGHTTTLSARLFRLLDQNQDGLVNFKEFITGLSESRCRSSELKVQCVGFKYNILENVFISV